MAGDRRVRYKIEDLGLADLVGELLQRGVTYEQISEEVERQTGQTVGKSSIARYNSSLQRRLEKIRTLRGASDAMAAEIRKRQGESGEETDMGLSDLLLDVFSQRILEAGTEEELDHKDLTFLGNAAANVVRSKTQMEQARQTERKRFAKAWKKATGELKKILEGSGLWSSVEEILSRYDPSGEAAG